MVPPLFARHFWGRRHISGLLFDSIARNLIGSLALFPVASSLRRLAAYFHFAREQTTELPVDPQWRSPLRAAASEVAHWFVVAIHDLLSLAGSFSHRAECRLLRAYWVWWPARGGHPATCRLAGR